jgi:hypothetical protein
VLPESQPTLSADEIAYTSAAIPSETASAPGRSRRRTRTAARLSWSRKGAASAARTATGTLTSITQRQPAALVNSPPRIIPATNPPDNTAPYTPSARVRSGPSRNIVVSNDSAAGAIKAPATPCTARLTSNIAPDCAKPAVRQDAANNHSPAMNMRRRPYRSAARPPSISRPPNASANAVITHCIASALRARFAWIDGSATFTIEKSTATMNCATQTSNRTSEDWRPWVDISFSLISVAFLICVALR